MDALEIDWYAATGEPFDKAGEQLQRGRARRIAVGFTRTNTIGSSATRA